MYTPTKARIAAMATLLTIASIFTLAQPAQATMGQCPSGYFCIWEDNTYQGHFARFTIGSSDLNVAIGGFVFNDKTTAVWNRTGRIWCTYQDKNYGGSVRSWGAGASNPNLSGIGWNDRISSLRRCP